MKPVLNLRQEEVEFYNTIAPPTDVILRRGEGVDVMEVDKDDLEEAKLQRALQKRLRSLIKHRMQNPPTCRKNTPTSLGTIYAKRHI